MNLRRKLYPNWKFWPLLLPVILSACLILIDDWVLWLLGAMVLPFLTVGLVLFCWNALLARLGKLSPEVANVLEFLLASEEFMRGDEIRGIRLYGGLDFGGDDRHSTLLRVNSTEVPLSKCENALVCRLANIRKRNAKMRARKSALEASSAAIDDLMRSQEIALTARLEALRARIEQKGLDSSPRNPIIAATKETQ